MNSPPAIVQLDTDMVRGVVGVGELLPFPSVTLKACYAVALAPLSVSGGSNGELTMTEGEGSRTIASSSRSNWLIGEDLLKATGEEGWEGTHELRWPFRRSKKGDDWEGREYVLSHLFSLLGIRLPSNTHPFLLIPPPSPPSLALDVQALYCQMAFEQLNVPALSILSSPLSSLFALGATTGIVLHIGHDSSEVFVVADSVVRWQCSTTVGVGKAHCEEWFEALLMADPVVERELRHAVGLGNTLAWDLGHKEKLIRELAETVWRDCTGDDLEIPPTPAGSKALAVAKAAPEKEDEEAFDVAKKLVGETNPTPGAQSHKSKKQQQQAATAAASKAAADAAAVEAAVGSDTITINIPSLPEKDITLGPVRHRLCEPLLTGRASGGETVWEGMGRALESATISLGERMSIWEGVAVVGEVARIKSFAPALMTYLSPFLLSSPDLPSDVQPARVRLLSIPDYFANYRGSTTDLAPFLGGTMVAKAVFSDMAGKHCVTKVDYNAKGPASIYAVIADDRER